VHLGEIQRLGGGGHHLAPLPIELRDVLGNQRRPDPRGRRISERRATVGRLDSTTMTARRRFAYSDNLNEFSRPVGSR
jgi:hypothetical protein